MGNALRAPKPRRVIELTEAAEEKLAALEETTGKEAAEIIEEALEMLTRYKLGDYT